MKAFSLALALVAAAPAVQAGEPQGASDSAAAKDSSEAQSTTAQEDAAGDTVAALDDAGGGAGGGAGRRERPRRESRERSPQPRFLGPPQPGGPPQANGLRRGRVLPPAARGRMVMDYQRQRLRRPPPGYAYYQVGDTIFLANRDTGLIFETVPVGPPPRP
ncbi:MAG TPA: RcnB family protein [Caulobacteraceae bacterium]|jgi:Ni/Co efflux regulator RcnB